MWFRRSDRRRRSLVGEDVELQRRVLGLVVEAHPETLTFDGLGAALLADPADLTEVVALAVAVRDLVLAGLLQSNGLRVLPTQAALHRRHMDEGR